MVKPYSFTVKTYSSAGKLCRKKIAVSVNRSFSERQGTSTSHSVENKENSNDDFEEDPTAMCTDNDIDEVNPQGSDKVTGYERRRIKEADRWKSLQDEVVKNYVETSVMPLNQCCVKCCEDGRPEVDAIMRCADCGPWQYFCSDCAETLHRTRNQFHIVEVWKDQYGIFVPLLVGGSVLGDPHHVKCPSAETRIITCVDQKGRQHLKKVHFCSCENNAATLIKLNLWPGSPSRPKVAFHLDLMNLAETFLLESHVSLHKFCDSIEIEYPTMLPKLVKNIYAVLNSGSFDEYRFFKHRLRTLDLLSIDLVDYTTCPLCPQNGESSVIIHSMDACFGLTRKKSAGNSFTTPNHQCLLFADQDEVDNFVDNYSQSKKIEGESCQTFKAGEVTEALRSKGKNSLFDEKGVFGSCCSRHTHPGQFLSTKYGERISYSVYELQHLLKVLRDRNPNVDVKVMYDIGCVLSSHLKANSQHDIHSQITIAIPIFHCYGHKASCQVEFSPRRLEGFGLTDGEAIERLWAYLRRFSSITKEMSASRRIDLLTDALLHLSRRNFGRTGNLLKMKLRRCQDVKEKSLFQLKEIFDKLPILYSREIVDNWEAKEREIMISKRNERKQYKESWQLRSVAACGSYEESDNAITDDSSVHKITKKLYSIEKKLQNMETKYSVPRRWNPGEQEFNCAALKIDNQRREDTLNVLHSLSTERYFLLGLKKKYADGQKIAIRLSKQITKITNKIKLTLEKCNATTDSLRDYINGLPKRITFDEVKDPMSGLYCDVEVTSNNPNTLEGENHIPIYIKRKAIDLNCFVKRCDEEEKLLAVEKERLLSYYNNMCSKIDVINTNLGDLRKSKHMFSLGARHELLLMRTRLQNELFDLRKLFQLTPDDTVIKIQAEFWNLSPADVESYTEPDRLMEYDCEDSDNEEEIEELSEIESDSE